MDGRCSADGRAEEEASDKTREGETSDVHTEDEMSEGERAQTLLTEALGAASSNDVQAALIAQLGSERATSLLRPMSENRAS